ncbi:MAG TPA: LON peptidase substrate-binding domain-containing protein [Candidatus Baltobacteraceae bacterium]|jgi:Lon protease-like protein|nr:LON peptidase substrate-binding domain-containing protein [Candidatus Baltobacteraceae bacterium]
MSDESVRLRLFPINSVLFPGTVLNLHIFEPRYKQLVTECLEGGETFGVAFIRKGVEAGDPHVIPHRIGTTAEISHVQRLEHGRYFLRTTGQRRFRINRVLEREPFIRVNATYLQEEPADDPRLARLLLDDIRGVFYEYLSLLTDFSGAPADILLPEHPIEASFLIGDVLQVGDAIKQRLLETGSAQQRLSVELGILRRLLPQLRTLMERKREEKAPPRPPPLLAQAPSSRFSVPDGEFRAYQEKFFGKHFSIN